MVRRRSLRAALVATAAVLVSTVTAMAPAGAPAHAGETDVRGPRAETTRSPTEREVSASRRAVRRAADRATPLAVTIDTLTPSSIPSEGDIRVAGSVTNVDSVPWLTVNVYSFVSPEPMTTRAELAAAVETDESVSVGERITDFGTYATIDAIQPGETRPFFFTVDRDRLEADTPGVYWFGVHALGQRADEGRDEAAVADGKARTFLPLVPTGREGTEPVSVVVPLRRAITYAEDGSLDDLDEWVLTLGVGGRLRSLVELGSTSGAQTVSWVVDPALLDAVRQLAAGNPPRSLEATLVEGEPDGEDDPPPVLDENGAPVEEPTESPSDDSGDDSGDGDGGAGDPTDGTGEDPGDAPGGTDGTGLDEPDEDATTADLPDDLDAETREAAEVAREWLGRLRTAIGEEDELLAVPYGDTDVAGAIRQKQDGLYLRARNRSAGPLPVAGRPASPVIAPPSGYLSPQAIGAVEDDGTILVHDKMFTDPPTVAEVSGRRVVVTSSGAADGGPTPGDPRGVIAMRQRILAEAAVRFLKPARDPLVVLLPYDWVPPASSTFFSGLALDWVDLTSVDRATGTVAAEEVRPDALSYPKRQVDFELGAASFAAAEALRDAGESLQDLLTLNNRLGSVVGDQALTSTSYSSRGRPDSARASADRSRAWIEERTALVEVDAPPSATLSSTDGSFPATITNGLDEPVTVRVAPRSDDGLVDIETPPDLDIGAGQEATVLLDASTDSPGVHEVTIALTDKSGRPLGGSDEMSIRSARVSNVIWLFMATGIGLLFGTIAFRLVRRVRAART